MTETLIPCVGIVVHDADGRLLLVKRARDPQAGCWSIPGGHVEAGESMEQAAIREAFEETGLLVQLHDLAGIVHLPAGPGKTFVIYDYWATVVSGTLRAEPGSDVAWVDAQLWSRLPLIDGLETTLEGWGALPAGVVVAH